MNRLRTFNICLVVAALVVLGLWIGVRWCAGGDEVALVFGDEKDYEIAYAGQGTISCGPGGADESTELYSAELDDPCGVCEIESGIVFELAQGADIEIMDETGREDQIRRWAVEGVICQVLGHQFYTIYGPIEDCGICGSPPMFREAE